MTQTTPPYVETQMLIRRPAETVFEAFIDPEITRQFWFTHSSGRLEAGRTITWEWEMYGVSTTLLVKEIAPNERIVIEWDDPATTVAFSFDAWGPDATYVVIRNYGFPQTGEELLQAIRDNTGGFTTVLDGLKAWLEHGIRLNLVADKFPQKPE